MSGVRGSFGLSPRPAAAAAAQQQQRGQGNGGPYPRLAASPKVASGYQPQAAFAFPQPDAAAAQFAAQRGNSSSSNGHWPPAQNGYGAHPSSSSSSQAHKRRAGGFDPYGNGNSNGSIEYGSPEDDDGAGQPHFTPFRSPLRRDKVPDELSQWKAQQAAIDAQKRRAKRVKYALAALLTAIVLVIFYLLGARTAPTQDEATPGVQVLVNTPASSSLPSIDGGVDAADELPPLEFGSDAANARRMLEELTAAEAVRERNELYDLEPSDVSPAIDPKDAEAIAKLDPVSRATVVVPQPGITIGGGAAVPEASTTPGSDAPARPSLPRAHGDEDPDLLRRLAETQAMNQRELEKMADEAAYLPRRARVVHEGQSLTDSDSDVVTDEGGVKRVPAHPTPSHASHLVIEQLIHDKATTADAVKPHPHKDHPSVPKVGRGIPSIPMPVEPKGKKKPASAPSPSPASPVPASPAAPAAASPAHGRKRDGKSETVDLDAPAAAAAAPADLPPEPAGSSEDELLSELSKARRPADVGMEKEEAAAKLNKKTGLKGPVLRGANAEAQAAGPEEGGAAAATEGEKPVKGPKKGKTVAALELQEKQAAAKAWAAVRGTSLGDIVEYPLAEANDAVAKKGGNVLLGADVQVIVLTSHKNQQLARKVKALYSPLVKRKLKFVSDARDNGLNATVLTNPQAEWPVKNAKEQPWRLYELFRTLQAERQRLGDADAPKFYLVMKDTTFPLLDQVRWRLERYTKAYKGHYPNFAGGRKSAQAVTADSAFYKEQQDAVAKMHKGNKLMIAPSYLWGFDDEFLASVSEVSRAATCPVLSTEGLALAGLVECSGGALERTEFDMFPQTRSNHREKKIDKDSAALSDWRAYDAFNGCNTPGILQEAYDAYYGKLKKTAAEE